MTKKKNEGLVGKIGYLLLMLIVAVMSLVVILIVVHKAKNSPK